MCRTSFTQTHVFNTQNNLRIWHYCYSKFIDREIRAQRCLASFLTSKARKQQRWDSEVLDLNPETSLSGTRICKCLCHYEHTHLPSYAVDLQVTDHVPRVYAHCLIQSLHIVGTWMFWLLACCFVHSLLRSLRLVVASSDLEWKREKQNVRIDRDTLEVLISGS